MGVVFENLSLFSIRFLKTNSNLRKQTPIFKRTIPISVKNRRSLHIIKSASVELQRSR